MGGCHASGAGDGHGAVGAKSDCPRTRESGGACKGIWPSHYDREHNLWSYLSRTCIASMACMSSCCCSAGSCPTASAAFMAAHPFRFSVQRREGSMQPRSDARRQNPRASLFAARKEGGPGLVGVLTFRGWRGWGTPRWPSATRSRDHVAFPARAGMQASIPRFSCPVHGKSDQEILWRVRHEFGGCDHVPWLNGLGGWGWQGLPLALGCQPLWDRRAGPGRQVRVR